MRYWLAVAVTLCALLGRSAHAQSPPYLVQAPPADPYAALSPSQAALGLQRALEESREAVFASDLLLGMQTGVRSQVALVRGDHRAFVAEAFYGALFHKLGSSEGAGVGGRF